MNRIIANPLLSLGVALGASAIAALPTMAQSPLSSYPTSAALPDIVSLQPISEPTNPDRSIYPNIPAAFGAQPFGISALEPDILPFGNSVVTGYAYSVTGGPKFRALLVPIGALPNAQTQLTLELPGFANQTLVL